MIKYRREDTVKARAAVTASSIFVASYRKIVVKMEM